MAVSKSQSSILSTLRHILRHVRREWDGRVQQATPTTREFAGHIMSQYRAGAGVRDRVKVRQMKANANSFLEYLRASEEQKVGVGSFFLSDSFCHNTGDALYLPPSLLLLKSLFFSVPPLHSLHMLPQSLLDLQRGTDPDKEMARNAAAKYVGLTMPEGIPLGEPTAPGKYKELVQKRLSGDLSDTNLEGVDFLKAQYYGAAKVLEEKRKQ